MTLTNSILVAAQTHLYESLNEQHIKSDDADALSEAAVRRAFRKITSNFLPVMINENARIHVETELKARLQLYANTFSEADRRNRKEEIREQFIGSYALPLAEYLKDHLERFQQATLQEAGDIRALITEDKLPDPLPFGLLMELIAVMVVLIAMLHAIAFNEKTGVTHQVAFFVEAGLTALLLAVLKACGFLRSKKSVEYIVSTTANLDSMHNATARYVHRNVSSSMAVPDMSDSKAENDMLASVEQSTGLQAVSPAQFFTYCFNVNDIAKVIQNSTGVPDDILEVLFQYMLPAHIKATMVQILPNYKLLFSLEPPAEGDSKSNDVEEEN